MIEALIARRFDGPLPVLSTEGTILDAQVELGRLPLAETLPLQGRALFAAASLEPAAREQAAWTRGEFFAELGAALGVSARVMHAAIWARRFPLAPPRPVPGYEYLGVFSSGGLLEVADPCHFRKRSRLSSGLSLSLPVEAHPGQWHVFVRAGTDDAAGRTAELAVIHDHGFGVAAVEANAGIAVDAGMAGVFDRECMVPDTSELWIEGVVRGRGAYARSGYGDGIYPLYVGRLDGLVAKLRLPFLEEDHPERDDTMPARPARRYAATETFAPGDAIEHPKFGAGLVVGAADGKIEVEFADGPRTLVHARR